MEQVGGRPRPTAHAADLYENQKPPHLRNQPEKDKWKNTQAQNRLMANKLREQLREPPANFHAPKGYSSLADARTVKAARKGKKANVMACTNTHQDVTPWPPTRCESAHITRQRHLTHINEENRISAMKLVELYTSTRPRTAHNPGGIHRENDYRGVDCLALWPRRTQLYAASTPAPVQPAVDRDTVSGNTPDQLKPPAATPSPQFITSGALDGTTAGGQPSEPAASLPPAQVNQAFAKKKPVAPRHWKVGKDLAFARCGGCAAYQFHKADGLAQMFPCRLCQKVWYCSELCARADWLNHKAVCQWASNGHWEPFGRKPVEEHWVANKALGILRRELCKRGKAALAQQAQRSLPQQAALATLAHVPHPRSSTGVPAQENVRALPDTYVGAHINAPQVDAMLDEFDALQDMYRKERAKELELENRQKQVEERAYWGLDGPRPCMYMGGKPV